MYAGGTLSAANLTNEFVRVSTGAKAVIVETLSAFAASTLVCLKSLESGGAIPRSRRTRRLTSAAVQKNSLVIGAVTANKRHGWTSAEVLEFSDHSWLCLITRAEQSKKCSQALARNSEDITMAIQFFDSGVAEE